MTEGLVVALDLVLAPLAAAYVGWLVATGQSNFGTHGVGHALADESSQRPSGVRYSGLRNGGPPVAIRRQLCRSPRKSCDCSTFPIAST